MQISRVFVPINAKCETSFAPMFSIQSSSIGQTFAGIKIQHKFLTKDCHLIGIEGDVRGENNIGVLGQASQVGVVTESLLQTTTSLTATATLAANV
jgi:hypothetical protein